MKPANISKFRPFPWLSLATFLASCAVLNAADNPFVGRWALTIPSGAPGWLGVEETNGTLSSQLLWGWGSVMPTASTTLDGGTLIVTRELKTKEGRISEIETITARIEGAELKLTTAKKNVEGQEIDKPKAFSGKRIPDLPASPDLSKVKFGAPVQLFNGKDLTGWRLTGKAENGWSVKDGVLENRPVKAEGRHFGNLRTDAEFEDFKLTTEVRTLEGCNSGIFLRGIYEVQIMESFGKPLNPHNMGALYSRITPSVNAEKPIGEWQTMAITLVDRHLTVILNDKTIIDNQPVLGCTGGAMTSDEFKPGPIILQGDHTSVDYRNMVLRPVMK
jgi:hypothetical protein